MGDAVPASDLPQFPASDAEAAARFEAMKSADPFPDIPPALLNTADLLDYIAATGMIYPFEVDAARPERNLKPASCAIPAGGQWLFWPPDAKDSGPTGRSGVLEPGGELWLEPNSIVYVTLEPFFRLPDYIAARYNLRIKHIYRGILVGTGPLVDPGFEGRLSVPLHNLTANRYLIKGGEPLVWMEFTKLSPNERWRTGPGDASGRSGRYVSFPSRKVDERKTVRDYVQYAHEGEIRSSIPTQTQQAAEAAKDAERHVRTIRNLISAAGVVVLIGIVGLAYQGLSFINDATDDEQALREDVTELRQELSRQGDALDACAGGGQAVAARCIRRELRAE